MDLQRLFRDLQRQMLGRLGIHDQIRHGSTKGSGTEASWRDLLGNYLPKRYSVTNGLVVDATGQTSDAIDIIIFDQQYSPFLLRSEDSVVVPAESVYAVLEVKQELSRDTIAYAQGKAASVRRLQRTSMPIVHAGGTFQPQGPKPILAGIVATRSNWQNGLGKPLEDALREVGAGLDLGCALEAGAFEQAEGKILIRHGEDALMAFFLATTRRLQAIGTVTAMDIGAYEHALQKPGRSRKVRDPSE